VFVTFDDGYKSNVSCVRPLLDRYQVPATFFLPTALIGGRSEFWWDLLARIVLETDALPERLSLTVGEQVFECAIGPRNEAVAWWKAWEEPSGLRQNAYAEIWTRVHALGTASQQQVMHDIVEWAGCSAEAREGYSVMTWEDVASLKSHPGIRIGSHGKDHVSLAGLSLDQQREQLSASRQKLEEAVHYSVDTLAYPFGSSRDFNSDTLSAAGASGYRVACTTETGCVNRATDLLRVPRFQVTDWDGTEFRKRISKWLAD
jgi:peptidoglycan/xylan/chitin deacetylase (PgdA/CDA1 family)